MSHLPGIRPKVRGHEISGLVHSIGARYTKGELSVGDRVLVYPWGGCQACQTCSSGHYLMCNNKHENADSETFGIWSDGGLQQYLTVVNTWRLVRLPEDSDMVMSCLVPCGGIAAYNAIQLCSPAIQRAIDIKGRANVVCYGAGCLALWMTEIIKANYGEKVRLCAIDLADEKLEDIRERGADETLCLPRQGDRDEAVGLIQAKFSGQGVDAAVDFVNVPASQERLFYSLAIGGVQVCVGLMSREAAQLNPVRMVIHQLSLLGAYAGAKEHLQPVLALLNEGKVKGPPVTLIKVEEVETVLRTMAGGGVYRGRFVVEMYKP